MVFVTGIMAAGKSTVCQKLAARFSPGVHLRGDNFRKMIVNGGVDMSADPDETVALMLGNLQQARLGQPVKPNEG